jgi:hypothetical protein
VAGSCQLTGFGRDARYLDQVRCQSLAWGGGGGEPHAVVSSPPPEGLAFSYCMEGCTEGCSTGYHIQGALLPQAVVCSPERDLNGRLSEVRRFTL